MANKIIHIFRNDCPNCYIGKVFKDKNFYFSIGFPKMHDHCLSCGYKFEIEPGFFFGAMYVSYGLAVAEALITYALSRPFFNENFDLRIFPIIAVVIILFSFFNIRLSRMIWIYLFKNYSL